MPANSLSLKFGLSLLLLFTLGAAAKPTSFLIGAQNIDYFPHYNFNSPIDKGYAGAILQAFADQYQYQFTYVTLPTKRLQTELVKGTVDFAYPDNERWQAADAQTQGKHYSSPIAYAAGGTMVRAKDVSLPIEKFKILAIPHGFTPTKWFDAIAKYNIRVLPFYDASAALQAVILGRADGADVEYHVARHLLKMTNKSDALLMGALLPVNRVAFKASTYKHPKVLKQLNDFIAENGEFIETLKIQYQLNSPENPKVIAGH